MPLIRLPQNYAIDTLASHQREAAMSYGEECIVLHKYHNQTDEGIRNRCPVCWDEVYSSSDPDCPACHGVGYELGIQDTFRIWAIFGDDRNDEKRTKKGTWEKEEHNFQCESYPTLMSGDYIIRVKQWDNAHRPVELGERYWIGTIQESTVRTGSRFGQNRYDVVGQVGTIGLLPKEDGIYNLQIDQNKPVERFDKKTIG